MLLTESEEIINIIIISVNNLINMTNIMVIKCKAGNGKEGEIYM